VRSEGNSQIQSSVFSIQCSVTVQAIQARHHHADGDPRRDGGRDRAGVKAVSLV
jgi:hypothetical protein